ncbi:uncharacterized protein F5Z01DRAFT_673485 [Emericellopsis atlantica]|uniref:Uncharacterized protein n=1 Tax=Emericellopsis atlantica TaxID=2614577 RepID=A0A9P7ZNG8_9HYPO|nr:uncharacterized protein F5Z01DRAFT_673485 [Emericellopsis atlantica]KAG9254932.1 hypothetical protein F5Z01DRAFT_673485 [Emericellopsis atlantica]
MKTSIAIASAAAASSPRPTFSSTEPTRTRVLAATTAGLFPGEPNCNNVCSTYFIPSVDDASGSREGIRCQGCGDDDPDEVEVHLNDIHFTLYKSGGFMMTPADGGALLGQCFLESDDYFGPCMCGPGDANYGQKFIRCETDITAWDTDYYYG